MKRKQYITKRTKSMASVILTTHTKVNLFLRNTIIKTQGTNRTWTPINLTRITKN